MEELSVSHENDLFQILLALKTNRRKRQELGEIFVESVAAIKTALLTAPASGALPAARALSPQQELSDPRALSPRRIIYENKNRLSDWAKDLIHSYPEAQLIRLSPQLMKKLSEKEEPSEIIVTFPMPRLRLSEANIPALPLILVLDRPSNPGNLGSICRSADAFGVDLLIMTGHSVDVWDPICIRSSLGAVFSLPILHEASSQTLEDWLGEKKREIPGFQIAGTDSAASVDLEKAALSPPLAILMGNEARGLSRRLKEFADLMVRIPISGSVDSLNIACATTVFLYSARCRPL